MILQELVRYYERKTKDPDSALAPEGWIPRNIDFLILLDEEGNFSGLQSLQTLVGNRFVGKKMLVPYIGKQAVKHNNSGKDANFLWDNSGFVLGFGENGNFKLKSFINLIDNLSGIIDDPSLKIICKFYKKSQEKNNFSWLVDSRLVSSSDKEIIKTGLPILTFSTVLDDGAPVFHRESIVHALKEKSSIKISEFNSICLIGGELCKASPAHISIKGLYGQKKIGPLVSFNEDAYCSYGKDKSLNAPVSESAVQKYTKGLQYLLDGSQKMQVGDSTAVFWATTDCSLENDFATYFSESPEDDPDRNIRAVKALLNSVRQGSLNVSEETTRFFVLGLVPNAARISVRFWLQGTVKDFSERIASHFDDIAIEHGPSESPFLSLFRLLVNTAGQGKAENIPPNLGGDMLRAILSGLPYPENLLQGAIRRVRAEQSKRNKNTGKLEENVSYPRAALIKACINRKTRFQHPNNPAFEEELKVSLDLSNTNPGYLLGRLFAVLEKIQEEAHPGLNATIRDRFYGAASSTPVTVFPNLLKLSKHHIAKIENKGRAVNLEKWIGEIMDGLADFPALLPMIDQGRFAIGYYHQKQAFYTRKSKSSQGEQE